MYSICTIGNIGVSVSVCIMHLCSFVYRDELMREHGRDLSLFIEIYL